MTGTVTDRQESNAVPFTQRSQPSMLACTFSLLRLWLCYHNLWMIGWMLLCCTTQEPFINNFTKILINKAWCINKKDKSKAMCPKADSKHSYYYTINYSNCIYEALSRVPSRMDKNIRRPIKQLAPWLSNMLPSMPTDKLCFKTQDMQTSSHSVARKPDDS